MRLSFRERRLALAFSAFFLLSRAAFFALGVRFQIQHVGPFWHYLDRPWLEHDLLRSLWYLHTQAPFMNLLAGILLKTLGDQAVWGFTAVYLALSLALHLSTLILALRMKARPSVAFAGVCLLAMDPSTALYENFALYTLPTTSLIALSALFLWNARRTGRWSPFFWSCAAITWMRTLFHLAWLASLSLWAAWLEWRSPRAGGPSRKASWRASLPPLAFAGSWYLKNLLVFGFFGASSWLGMSLARVTVQALPSQERSAYIASGQLSGFSAIRSFSRADSYFPLLEGEPSRTGVPALDEVLKSDGEINLNHLAMVEVSRRYGQDSRRAFLLDPGSWWTSTRRALRKFVEPAYEFHPLNANREKIRGLEDAWTRLFHFRLGRLPHTGLSLLALPLLLLYAALRLARTRDPAARAVLIYSAGMILYVAAVGCAVEIGENNRFRFQLHPLVIVLGARALSDIGTLIRSGMRRRIQKTRVNELQPV